MSMPETTGAGRGAVVTDIGGEAGRAVAAALLAAGFRVAGAAGEPAALDAAIAEFAALENAHDPGDRPADRFEPLLGDAADPALVDWTIGEFRPDLLVVVADEAPEVAVQQAFLWCREMIMGLVVDGTTVVLSPHSSVRSLVEDAARNAAKSEYGMRFLMNDTAATPAEAVAAVLASALPRPRTDAAGAV